MARREATVTCSDGVETIVALPEPPWHEMWDVPEVLENILVRLPMKDLLLDQRVCTQWRDLIQAAPRLQEALFFKPVSTRQIGRTKKITRKSNSLLEAIFPMWFPKDIRNHQVIDVPWAASVTRLVILRRDASWRRMLTAQPPLTVWEEAYSVKAVGRSSLRTGSVEVEDGLRMGLVYDRTELMTGEGRFHVLTDGFLPKPSEESESGESTDSSHIFEDEDKRERKRVFGGQGILTLLEATTKGVCVGLAEWTPKSREFLSSGAEDVDIHMKDVEGPQGNCWWTEIGYLRPDHEIDL